MIKENIRTIRLIAFYFVIIGLLAFFMPRQVDWNPSFSVSDNIPYGAEALVDNLKNIYKNEIKINELPLYNLLKNEGTLNSSLIIITEELGLDSLDLEALYEIAGEGNDVFIAADHFEDKFLDTLGLSSILNYNNFANLEALEASTAALSLEPKIFHLDSSFSFKSQWSDRNFQAVDSSEMEIFGLGKVNGTNNFVRIPFGKGNFYLHNFPYAFTNYYLLKAETRSYISHVFSVLREETPIIWDEYYKPKHSNVQRSPLRVLLNYPSFRWAYWLILIGVMSYILFYSKRKQRMIPVITPPQNENLKFVKTLGSLYYNKGSHKDIFDKRMRIFKEDMNRRFFLKDLEFTKDEAKILAAKSGKDLALILHLFEMLQNFQQLKEISDGQLKVFIRKLNTFYDRN